ncbi:MAG: hypothetical protein Q8L79_06605 [Methylobacter sp.]|uniref:hypothetical protein n=1 Tax=Methylobacter sp. TaxID=2051955 RepID=UPI002731BB7A|nr:hypothetical protein [Methylobacter sp.]MDP1664785.1 hypothetical protein [Methylobacter sp.]
MSNSLLPERMLKRNFISSLFIIIVVIGISEALVMLLLDVIQQWIIVLTPIQGAALDALLLTCLSAPLLWWLALRPLVKRIASKQTRTEEQARLNSELRTSQGLSLSHSIVVEKHRGKLFFESTAGLGTTFHVRLPIKLEERE